MPQAVLTKCLVLISILFAGCASGPEQYHVHCIGDKDLNQTLDGSSSAVTAFLYQVKDKSAWDQADMNDLLNPPPSVPPTSPWAAPPKECLVYTGQKAVIDIMIEPSALFLGVVGLFNEDKGASKQLLSRDEIDDKTISFKDYAITIVAREE